MVVPALVRLFVVLLAWVPGAGPLGATARTTTGDAAEQGYDVTAVTRADVYRSDSAGATAAQFGDPREGSASRPVGTRGTVTTSSGSFIATNTADDLVGLADDVATVVRPASTPWGRTVQDFQVNGDAWSRVSAHAEAASGQIYRGGTSIEEVFTSGDQWLVRHQIYDSTGNLVHETFRPCAKFGAG